MVLQSDVAAPVWGRAEPGERVKVTFAGQSLQATADEAGRWNVRLQPMAPGTAGSLIIEGDNRIFIQDVLVGEVWLAAGQSNMQLRVNEAAGGPEAAATADLPQVRTFTVPQRPAGAAAEDCGGQWVVCHPKTVGRFSAAGFYFARELHASRATPVGLINASWGATPIEAWTSLSAMAARPELAPVLAHGQDPALPAPRDKAARPRRKIIRATFSTA
jgi:sialate O-acetylesterase